MSSMELARHLNLSDITGMFILATLILLMALVQRLKPTLSITYLMNNNPSYLKAKFISKLITSATLYICGFYFYYFTDLTKLSMAATYALVVPIMLYHGYKWVFTKLIDSKTKNKGI